MRADRCQRDVFQCLLFVPAVYPASRRVVYGGYFVSLPPAQAGCTADHVRHQLYCLAERPGEGLELAADQGCGKIEEGQNDRFVICFSFKF